MLQLSTNIIVLSLVIALKTHSNWAIPVTQPTYANNQYVSAQAIPVPQYRQPAQSQLAYASQQPQYITASQPARPVYESNRGHGLQKYSTQTQPIQQTLLSTNVDRQIQRIAQNGGPLYLQQVQNAQLNGQAQQAFATAQRQIPQQPQVQYLKEVVQQPQQQYVARPAAQGYSQQVTAPQQQRQPQEQLVQQEKQEDYDSNPSYKFGFDVNDDLYTNYQNRKEQREGNKITGSYSVVDSDGFIRTVTYTADPKEGFKAQVTRQPTDIVVKVPKPDPQFARQQPQQYIQAGEQDQTQQAQPQYQY